MRSVEAALNKKNLKGLSLQFGAIKSKSVWSFYVMELVDCVNP